jgi:hypothetical protein
VKTRMISSKDIGHQIMEVVNHFPGCDLEDVVAKCNGLTWNQIFLELDRLSRRGRVVLKQTGLGHYTVSAQGVGQP